MALIVKYPSLNAKLKGMYSKKISKENLDDVIKQVSLKSTISFLKSKSELFKEVDENADRLEIEQMLEKNLIDDINKILKFMNKKDADDFNYFLLQFFSGTKQIKTISNIDKNFFEKLFDKVKHNKNLRKIIGSQIDLLNVMWIYRVNKYYSFEKDKISKIIINRYYKLDYKLIVDVMNANDFQQIKNIMSKTIYKDIFDNELNFENNIDRYLYNINKKVFKQNILDVSYIYAYINLVNYENNDIVNIIEGIRYEVPKIDIQRRMVR